jgi:sulfoxide reductase heme-binding subunit YedZ
MERGSRGEYNEGHTQVMATGSPSSAALTLEEHWPRMLAHAAGLVPLVWVAIEAALGDVADPARVLILRSGAIGLALLVAALACTPLATLTGWRRVVQVRRAIGLYAFAYVTVHVLAYATFDGWLDPALIWRDLGERRSMLVGFASFLLLVPLAATSTTAWQRRLGQRWKMLHRLVYLAALLGVLHYLWLERDVIDGPVLAAAGVGVLLALRLPPVRRAVVRGRQHLAARGAAASRQR